MNFSPRRWATNAVLLLMLSSASALPVRAEILSGCVAPEDAGVSHLVGWVDGGVMLGMADPEPPTSLQVTAPDGSVVDYRDGVGLLVPTDVLPIWFAAYSADFVRENGYRAAEGVGSAYRIRTGGLCLERAVS